MSCLHPTAKAARPKDVIRAHPRLSKVCIFEHLDTDIKEIFVISLQ